MKRDSIPETHLIQPKAHTSSWHAALIALGVLLAWVVASYASTGRAMASIWLRSDTFAHGLIVPPITLWLVWRMRHELSALTPRPAWWSLGLVAAVGCLWLLGEVAAVNSVSQFALTALVVAAVIAVLGTTVARRLAFPLGFLFFAVPMGDFIMPQLME